MAKIKVTCECGHTAEYDESEIHSHRLMCGDSTSEADVRRLVGGDEADLVLTDPPYGISVVGGDKAFGKVGGENIVESRVKTAIQKTTSPHLRRDYMKHLRKLERIQHERRRC